MEFRISILEWNGSSYNQNGRGCAIGQMLAQLGRKPSRTGVAHLVDSAGLEWLTDELVADLANSTEYHYWNKYAEVWLRAVLTKHGHTLIVTP